MTGRVVFWAVLTAAAAGAHAPSISLTKKYLNFTAAPGGGSPLAQSVILSNVTHGRMPWTAAASTSRGGNWLSVNPASGLLAGSEPFEFANLGISVSSTGLAAGVYYGTITIHAPGDALVPPADNTPQTVEVALTIGTGGSAAPGIGLSTTSVFLDGVTGGPNPVGVVQVNNTGGGLLSWTAAAEAADGRNWLAISAAGAVLTVTGRMAGMTPGSYSGRVTISAAGAANSPQSIAVTFRVRDPAAPALSLNPPSIGFAAASETSSVAAQRVEVLNAGEGALNWRIQVNTFNGGPWLAASPNGGGGPGGITVSVDPRGLEAGTYAGRITVTAEGAANSPWQVPVSLAIQRPQPSFESRGVVNAATFLTGFLAPGEILTVFGSRLGPRPGAAFTLDPATGKLPESLAGTRVTFDGIPAPLFFAGYDQVNLQVPYELAGRSATRMVLSADGLDPAEASLPLRDAAPGAFTVDGVRAAALNQDFTLNSPANAAERGSVVQLFLTGLGVLDPAGETGALAPSSPLSRAALPVKVTMDGIEARVLFAGAAPGFAGLEQVNVEVPREVRPSGEVSVSVLAGPHPMGKRVTIAVR